MTPSTINVRALTLPLYESSQVSQSTWQCIAGIHCALFITVQGVHYQRITDNAILHLSYSLFSNSNELQSGRPTTVLLSISQYRDACIELRLTFSNVYHILF